MRGIWNKEKCSKPKQRALLSSALKSGYEFSGRSLRKLLRCSGLKVMVEYWSVGAHKKSAFRQRQDLEAGESFILPVIGSFQATRFSYVKDCRQLCLNYISEFFICIFEGNEVI